jgi:hypothetical protein
MIPLLMNDFFVSNVKRGQADVFKDNPSMTCMLIYHLCNWLYSRNLTKYKLKLNLAQE